MNDKFNNVLELIYRNICYSQNTCHGCIARNELEGLPEYKTKYTCLIPEMCVFDLIDRNICCKDCPFVEKTTMTCSLLIQDYNGDTRIKSLNYIGYWKVY